MMVHNVSENDTTAKMTMDPKDKKNLLRSWPIYAMFIMMLIGLFILSRKHPPRNEPLGKSISRHFGRDDLPLDSLDNIINARTSWTPILPDAINKPVRNFEFVDLQGTAHALSDFSGDPVLVVFLASWSPACKMMRPILQQAKQTHENLTIIGLSTDSVEQLNEFAEAIPLGFYLARQDKPLDEPFAQVSDLPTCFFIKPDGSLKMAATGLIPFEHINAIIDLQEEPANDIP